MTILLRIVFVVLLFTLAAGAEPQLSVRGNLYEGSALFLRLTNCSDEEAPRASIEGGEHFFTEADDGIWEVVVPLSIDSRGEQKMKIETAEKTWNKKLRVKSRHYGHQFITLSPSTLAGYDNPQNKADDKAILKAQEEDQTPRLFSGDFRIPVQAPESTGFGLRRTYNGWKKGWHKGLDLAGWEGEGIVAPAEGVVIHKARGLVNGNTIVLSHGAGVSSVYFHLNSIAVREGQKVKKGQNIGTVGGTGGFAPHLHWEMRVKGTPVNPKLFFAVPDGW